MVVAKLEDGKEVPLPTSGPQQLTPGLEYLRPPNSGVDQLRDKIGHQSRDQLSLCKIAPRAVGWDFDGTIAETEFMHRATFRVAVEQILGFNLSETDWRAKGFVKAFGLPGNETCEVLARATLATNPDYASRDFAVLAEKIRHLRFEAFRFFIRNATLREVESGARVELVLDLGRPECVAQPRLVSRLEPVRIATNPGVIAAVDHFAKRGVPQGVCTSSSREFVQPLLDLLGLTKNLSTLVSEEDVPTGLHKPHPYPWRLLYSRLLGAEVKMCHRMLVFENSAGGAISGMRAGATTTTLLSTSNLSPVLGKVADKLRKVLGSGSSNTAQIDLSDIGRLISVKSWSGLALDL